MVKPSVENDLRGRIAKLEAGSQAANGSVWEVVLSILPKPLIIVAACGWAGLTGFEYYSKAQQDAAQTKLAKVEADFRALEARTKNAGSAETQKLQAQLAQKRAEADQARVEADAMRSRAGELSAQEKKVRAALAATKGDAEKTRLEAEAMNAQFGGDKLESRLQWAELIITEMDAAMSRGNAEVAGVGTNFGMIGTAAMKGYCDNKYAKDLGCPREYWPKEKTAPATVESGATQRGTTQEKPPEKQAAKAGSAKRYAVVDTDGLNLRKCPEASDACPPIGIGPLPRGLTVELLGDAGNGWSQVETATAKGLTLRGFVKTNKLKI